MSFDLKHFDRFVVILWRSLPVMADVERLQRALEQAYREAKRPLVVVVHVPPSLDGVPETDVRDAMVGRMRRLLNTSTCESMHTVVTQPGVAGSMQRTVMRGMAVVVGLRRQLFVHDSVASCVARLRALGAEPSELARVEQALR
ncbi:MAG TPA: hypothetical protein VMG12_45500 [Polyangiaceae bacterium]|nr:hypothetical protein [Polyangiaceae bacterium]